MKWKVGIWAAALSIAIAAPAMAVPNLRLNVSGGPTFEPGQTITVTLDVDTIVALDAINGVQALLQYDPALVALSGIAATQDISGDAGVTADNWLEAVLNDDHVCGSLANEAGTACTVDGQCTGDTCDATGDLTYAVVINAAGISTFADHTVATLTFTAIATGGPTAFAFRADANPVFTKLTRESDNGAIFPVKFDSASITLICDDGNECTTDVVVAEVCQHNSVADGPAGAGLCSDGNDCTQDNCLAGACDNPNEVDGFGCTGNGAGDCTAADTCLTGACQNNDAADGAALPGLCGDANDCTQDNCLAGACANPNEVDGTACVDANACTTPDTCTAGACSGPDPANSISVSISIPAMAPGIGFTEVRDVTFVLTTCDLVGGDTTVTITQPVSFDENGFGTTVLAGVPTGAGYLSARTGHTLSRLAPPIVFDACGDDALTLTAGSALISGDFQNEAGTALQDGLVDITDFSILASVFNTPAPVDHNVGADATGDGQQATADFVAIQQSFLLQSDAADACPIAFGGGPFGDGMAERRPTYRIPVRNLSFSTARAADLNEDGVVDVKDIRDFAWQYNLPLLPEFSDKLDSIEAEEEFVRRNIKRSRSIGR